MRAHHSSAIAIASVFFAASLLLSVAARPATAIEVAAFAWSFEDDETPVIDSAMGGPPITASATHMSDNGQADATATLDGTTSSLGLSVQADTTSFILQTAAAAFTESFTFTEADEVSFTFDVDGMISGSDPNEVSLTLGASVDINATDDLSMLPIFVDSAMFTNGTSSLTIGPIAFEANVAKDVSFVLSASGILLSGGNYNADFLNTVTLTGVSNPNLTSTGSGNAYTAVAAVPEPSTFALTLIGLLSLSMIGRRRTRR